MLLKTAVIFDSGSWIEISVHLTALHSGHVILILDCTVPSVLSLRNWKRKGMKAEF